MFSLFRRFSLVALLILGTSALSLAADFDAFLVPGAVNNFEDNSREAFFDTGTGNSGTFGVGDVVVGFVHIENRSGPNPTSLGNTTYAVFSQQVTGISSGVVTFGTTTVTGLTMDALVTGASSSAMVSLISRNAGFSTDLILAAPTNQTGTSTVTMADYIKFLTNNGTLQATFGINAINNFFTAALTNGTTPSTNDILISPQSISFASFSAGLSLLQSSLTFGLANDVVCNGAGVPITVSQLCISGGEVHGGADADPANFLNGSEFGASPIDQCGESGDSPCGFVDNAHFAVHPVPEPTSMILFGFGLAAIGMYGRRSRAQRENK